MSYDFIISIDKLFLFRKKIIVLMGITKMQSNVLIIFTLEILSALRTLYIKIGT